MATVLVFPQLSIIEVSTPATSPQNAAPIPNSVIPEADTRMVIRAGSRWVSSSRATLRLLPMVLNRASPAIAKTNSFGKA